MLTEAISMRKKKRAMTTMKVARRKKRTLSPKMRSSNGPQRYVSSRREDKPNQLAIQRSKRAADSSDDEEYDGSRKLAFADDAMISAEKVTPRLVTRW